MLSMSSLISLWRTVASLSAVNCSTIITALYCPPPHCNTSSHPRTTFLIWHVKGQTLKAFFFFFFFFFLMGPWRIAKASLFSVQQHNFSYNFCYTLLIQVQHFVTV